MTRTKSDLCFYIRECSTKRTAFIQESVQNSKEQFFLKNKSLHSKVNARKVSVQVEGKNSGDHNIGFILKYSKGKKVSDQQII